MKIKDLKKWLKDKPDKAEVSIMIETEDCQYQYDANDIAMVYGPNPYIVIMHEKKDKSYAGVK